MIPLNTKTYVSDSGLHRAEECAASQALPYVPHSGTPAAVGSAKHEHLELRARWGLARALDELESICDRWGLVDVTREVTIAQCHKFKWMPPQGAVPELALAWDCEGRAIMVEGGRGSYTLPPGAWGPGTIDLMWSEPEPLVWQPDVRFGSAPLVPHCPAGSTLYLADYKTGEDKYVAPVENNPQLASGASKAAALTGATSVVPVVIFVTGEQGVWDQVTKPWGPERLAEARARVLAIHRAAMAAKADAAKGIFRPREGMHCLYCDAFTHCPAKVSMVNALLERHESEPFDASDAPRLVAIVKQLELLTRDMKALLKATALETGKPIDLGGGLFYGERVSEKLKFVSHVALPILQAEIGDDAMDAFETSKSRMYAIIRSHLEGQGIKRMGSKVAKRVLDRIAAANASYVEPKYTYTWYREDDDNSEEAQVAQEDFEI